MKAFVTIGLCFFSTVILASQEFKPNEYIIRFKSFRAAREFYANPSNRRLGSHEILTRKLIPFGLIRIQKGAKEDVVRKLRNDPLVDYVDTNQIYRVPPTAFTRARKAPNDNRFQELWGLYNSGQNRGVKGMDINAVAAWKLSKGLPGVVVAIIDSGIDYNHPDLKANLWINREEVADDGLDNDGNGVVDDIYGYNASVDNGDPYDGNGHGTHCAGTIGAVHDNRIGVAGVMGRVQLMAVKIFSDSGFTFTSDILRGIEYAIAEGAHVLSNSWGGGFFSPSTYELIKEANRRGILFVAAAGNDGRRLNWWKHYPSSYNIPNVIAVAAMDSFGNKAEFSNYGRRVHVTAPGVKILSTLPNGLYGYNSGTSMATPHVSGIVGLVLAKHGLRSAKSMRERLIGTSKPVESLKGVSLSNGVVDASAAIRGQR